MKPAELLAMKEYIDVAVETEAARRIAALPTPASGAAGKDGDPGPEGDPGEQGDPGEKGEPGKDGKDGRDGRDGKDGKDGRDGKDGITLDHLDRSVAQLKAQVWDDLVASIEYDGERTFSIGGKAFRVPVPLDRGVFKEGEAYERGDIVTWAGSGWICREDTTEKPGDGATAWRLFAKKGRDGRDGDRRAA